MLFFLICIIKVGCSDCGTCTPNLFCKLKDQNDAAYSQKGYREKRQIRRRFLTSQKEIIVESSRTDNNDKSTIIAQKCT